MAFFRKPNDVLEVVEDKQDGTYKVYSENDYTIYHMTRTELELEEARGAEVIWEAAHA